MLPGVLQPGGQVIERVPPGNVIYKESARCTSVVRPGDGPEGLLARLQEIYQDIELEEANFISEWSLRGLV